MDLDDILNRAEDHETLAQAAETGASLGGEGFLQQFAAVSDIKNDMSWEDIIPLEERQKYEEMEAAARNEELLNQSRKRTTTVNYEGMDGEHPAASSSKPTKKATKPSAPRKTAAQRSMELKERDVRVLIRSLQRWGDIRVRYDTIVRTHYSEIHHAIDYFIDD
jgi:chromodomain-helicase-DNA-binding protein 1